MKSAPTSFPSTTQRMIRCLDVALTAPLIERLAASAVKQRFADVGYKRVLSSNNWCRDLA